jgi:muramoyltetrapeptide carboxypeptidase
MKAPAPISGGRIGIFAPSSPYPQDRFAPGVAALHELGFETKLHPQAESRRGYLAGTDEARVAALHDLLVDPEVNAIIAARGGYGLHRIVDKIDVELLVKSDKPIIGFSDVSVLHGLLQSQAKRISIHGPVVTQLATLPPADRQRFVEVLRGDPGLRYESRGPTIHGGRAEGRLYGGCLSVVAPLVGTPFLPNLDGAILLLEDVGEATYRIDRLLSHLRLAGVFDRIAGLALGDFVDCKPQREGEMTVEEVIRDIAGDLGLPVLMGLPFGHGSTNQAVPLGAEVILDADARILDLA